MTIVGSYPTRFTLTPHLLRAIHKSHYGLLLPEKVRGGIVSVALSLGSPPVAASNYPSLCCPDFPRTLLHVTSR